MKDQLKKRLSEISIEISKLETEKYKIENQLIELSDNFIDKFKIWYSSGQGGDYDFLPPRNQFPLLRKFVDDRELNRYQSYTIEDVIGDDIMYVFLDYENAVKSYGDIDCDRIIIKYKPIIDEVMEGKLKSFTCDW